MIGMMKKYVKAWLKKKRFRRDCQSYNELNKCTDFRIDDRNVYPVYEDENQAGALDEHYFLQDIWMAKQVKMGGLKEHFDVGSRVDGFIAHLLSMDIVVTLIDIRRLAIDMADLKFIQGDATNMASIPDETIASLSSLHAVEHFGLGRYGDAIDPDAWKKALHSFERVLKKEGRLYLSVPIGHRNHVVYNAHRIFNPQTIISEMADMVLVKFAYIEDYKICEVENFDKIADVVEGKDYLCGCFVFCKK